MLRFFIMNAQTGRCLNTKDSIAKKKGYTRWRHECSGDYNRYRVEPTGEGSTRDPNEGLASENHKK